MKKIIFLVLSAAFFLTSCAGLQFTVGVSGQVGGQYPQGYPQQQYQQPCQQQPYYYSPGPYGPVDPVFLSPGQHRCPQP